MALSLPADFYRGIQGKDTNLVPFVTIGKYNLNPDDWIYLSTNNITVSKMVSFGLEWGVGPIKNCSPILLNVPSLKESIDIETRNYKISNVTLDISNYEYNGKRFSELIGDNPLINEECRIYWTNPAVTDNKFNTYDVGFPMEDDHAFEVYSGTIRRYEITGGGDKVKLVVEDRSQATLHKDLPLENVGTENVPDKYKNKYVPMVYGHVDRSPVVHSYQSITDAEDSELLELRLKIDTSDALTGFNSSVQEVQGATIPQSALYFFENDIFWNVTKVDDAGVSNFEYELANGSIRMDTDSYPSEDVADATIENDFSRGQLGIWVVRQIKNVVYSANNRSPGQTYFDPNTDMGKITGTILVAEGGGTDWYGYALLNLYLDDVTIPNNLALKDDGSVQSPETYFYARFTHYNYSEDNTPLGETGNPHGAHTNWNVGRSGDYVNTTMAVNTSLEPDKNPLGSYDFNNITGSNDPWPLVFAKLDSHPYIHLGMPRHNDAESQPDGTDYTIKINFTLHEAFLTHRIFVEGILDKEYYANVNGRLSTEVMDNIVNPTPTMVIADIINMLGDHTVDAGDTSGMGGYGWRTQFTVNKKINSKKLIEGIASASPYLPRFTNMGEFKFDVIKKSYGITDLQDADGNIIPNTTILEEDCIDWSYSRTPIEDVKTAVELKYHFDYGRDDFSKDLRNSKKPDASVYGSNVLDIDSMLGGYSNNYYGLLMDGGLNDHSESTLVVDDDRGKYIRDDSTAYAFAEWMLLWNCNQHLKIKVKLPLKYMNLEIGDIVEYKTLLGGVAPYGISYQKGSSGQDREINGQIAYPYHMIISTNKTLEWVEIETIMMHSIVVCESSDYDCADICDGTAEVDICGLCTSPPIETDITQCVECPPDSPPGCDNICGSGAVVDACGECGGDATGVDCWTGDVVCSEADCPNIALQEGVCMDAGYDNESECVAYGTGATWWTNGCYLDCSCGYIPEVLSILEMPMFDVRPHITTGYSEGWQYGNPDWCNTMSFKLAVHKIVADEVHEFRSEADNFYMKIEKTADWLEGEEVETVKAQLISDNEDVGITWGNGDSVDGVVETYDSWDYSKISFPADGSGGNNSLFIYIVGEDNLLHGDEFTLYLKCDITALRPGVGVRFNYTTVMKVNYEIVECPAAPGDLNGDGLWNIQDLVILANCVLAPNCETNCLDEETGEGNECYGCAGLLSADIGWNILDIVILANCVLGDDCGD